LNALDELFCAVMSGFRENVATVVDVEVVEDYSRAYEKKSIE